MFAIVKDRFGQILRPFVLAHFLVITAISCPSFLLAELVSIQQISAPVGFINQTTVKNTGEDFQTNPPALTSNGYAFGYWSLNGQRMASANGRSLTRPITTVVSGMNFTAHYFEESADTDNDGIRDWFEYRNFGDLNQTLDADSDGDQFNNGQEDALGQEPTIADRVADGGISLRSSTNLVYGRSNLAQYKISSNPVGFISEEIGFAEMNTTKQSPNLHGAQFGYHFAYWTINGVRQGSPTGVALSMVQAKLETQQTDLIAHYYPTSEDNDTDGVMDWFELYQFGNLSQGPNDDTDLDSFTNTQEGELGQEATIKDLVRDGGISARSSANFVYADPSLILYSIDSHPIGFVEKTDGYVPANTLVETPNLHGEKNGYYFAYWTVNGVRQAGPTGVAKTKISLTVSQTVEMIAVYKQKDEDSDSDGVMDWFEYYQFGDLTQGPDSDSDSDNFSNRQESILGQEPTIKDRVADGGISARSSTNFVYLLQANRSPYGVDISTNEFFADEPSGHSVGTLLPLDYDDPNQADSYTYSLVSDSEQNDNNKFTISGNQLKTNTPLALGQYSIRVKITDSGNGTFTGNINLTAVVNGNKDTDGDGLSLSRELALGTDPNKADTDGDGFADNVELQWGTDPLNANSLPNKTPTNIELSGNTIKEGQPIGSMVGDLKGIDPDQTEGFGFTLVSGTGSTHNESFKINSDGVLITNDILDYEKDSLLNIRIRVNDKFNASFEKTFSIEVVNAFIPIPETSSIAQQENIFILNGKILTNGGLAVTEVGFLMDQSIHFTKPQKLASTLDPKTNRFSFSVKDTEEDKVYYIRAYARNSEGRSVGAIKKFSKPKVDNLSSWAGTIIPQSGGWYTSSWFGSFKTTSREWIYHTEMQWLYPAPMKDGSIWLWNQKDGWRWTQEDVFPYLFRWRDSTWIYLYGRKDGELLFYNYSTQSYE